MNVAEKLLDPYRLLFREPAKLDRAFNRRSARPSRRFPCWKLPLEVLEGSPAVGVGGRLREDRLDQDVERIESSFELGDSVHSTQILNDVRHALGGLSLRLRLHALFLSPPGKERKGSLSGSQGWFMWKRLRR